ncbi:uncharacterized protein LOC143557434 [Bidens hawaiensis]|uniref:uncharacterized protein LOC143557434 n=1 Tax=Bidens hawaiensis TaxID=980011 RepID=UPI00404A8CA6
MIRNRQLTSTFIANEFMPMFKAKPNWPTADIQTVVREKYKVIINKWMAYNAKRSAYKKLHGSMRDHYSKLGSYIAALKNASPSSTFELLTAPPGFPREDSDAASSLETFSGLKKGFLAGCRKVLFLDGCFLKTFLGGILLAAVGRDANNQMYPVAWAVVEGENNDSWEWFMNQLSKCLEVTDGGRGWTLISDQQKNAEHINCARHIYANWKKEYKGEDYKEVYWRACRAYNEADYNVAMKDMLELSPDAVEAYVKQNPKCFSRCFLDTNTKCDLIVNNMAETFNGTIVQARSKDIIHMLEDMRVLVMTRLTTRYTEMLQKDVFVCPRVQTKLDKEKSWAHKCKVFPSYPTVFQVSDWDDVSVDIGNKTCTCKRWELSGIPCKHVRAVAGFMKRNSEEFVHESFLKEKYLKAYQFTIPPLPDEKYWPIVDYPLDPPPVKAMPG